MPALSQRGQERLTQLGSVSPFTEGYYDPKTNPNGLINLGTAENSLLSNELLDYMHKNFRMSAAHLKYRSALTHAASTIPSAKQAVPRYLNKTLKPLVPITPDHCVVGPGIGAVFAQLIWHLCDEGEGVLMTAPFYENVAADYTRDIIYPAKAIQVIVPVPAEVDSLSPAVLPYIRKTILEFQSSGGKLRVLLTCNPHNPTAQVYPPETILGYAALAEEFDFHLIVDEVFANELFPSSYVKNPTPFRSVLSMDTSSYASASRIHVLAGPTKDFGASGVKVGALVSYNAAVLRTVADSLSSTPISSAADALFTTIMNDGQYCEWFLTENRQRLTHAFELVARWCDFHKFPFVPAQAGVFMLIDFGSLMSVKPNLTVEEKVTEFLVFVRKAGVRLWSPALSQDPVGTRFRVVFTLPEENMKLALYRIEAAFNLAHQLELVNA
ncbi:PLP-dependent transferase [Mucidula mucida]|nr:PLP-dependent transferase [Mucidula mucida]